MEIKWYQLLFQIVNFGILVWLLNRFLYRPILKIVEQRNKKIEDSIKAAEETLKEKEKIALLKKQAAAEAEKEAVAIVERAKTAAAKTGKQILVDAREEAQTAVEKRMKLAAESLERERERLMSQVSDLVITTTKQMLKDSLGAVEQRRILDKQIKELGEKRR